MVDHPPVPPTLDAKRQEEARRFGRDKRRWMLVDLVVGLALLLVFLFSGASARLAAWAESLTPSPWIALALYGLVLFVGYTLLTLPLSYLGGFRLSHRYGMSRQSLGAWAADQGKGALLSLLLGGVVIETIYALLRWQPAWWWLYAAVFMLLLTVVLGQLAPVLILPLFYKLTPLEDEALRTRLQRLGAQAGTRISEVYTINLSSKSPAANAMVMGLGRTRRIALGDTLYEEFTADEIETIFAHELGHIVHGDLPRLILVQAATTVGGLWLADLFLQWGVARFGFASIADIGAFPLFLLAMGLFSFLTLPLSNAYSRSRERMADRYALESTRDPASMEAVMTRLANQNLSDADPPRWVRLLLLSHPPVAERIAAARAFDRQRERAAGSA